MLPINFYPFLNESDARSKCCSFLVVTMEILIALTGTDFHGAAQRAFVLKRKRKLLFSKEGADKRTGVRLIIESK